MKKILMISTVALSLGACATEQGNRAATGAVLGGAAGAVIGGAATGRGSGALAGAAIGAAGAPWSGLRPLRSAAGTAITTRMAAGCATTTEFFQNHPPIGKAGVSRPFCCPAGDRQKAGPSGTGLLRVKWSEASGRLFVDLALGNLGQQAVERSSLRPGFPRGDRPRRPSPAVRPRRSGRHSARSRNARRLGRRLALPASFTSGLDALAGSPSSLLGGALDGVGTLPLTGALPSADLLEALDLTPRLLQVRVEGLL